MMLLLDVLLEQYNNGEDIKHLFWQESNVYICAVLV
jgi:hypothetical protein